MPIVTVDSIIVKNNPSYFFENIQFEVTFTTLCKLEKALEWKIVYVGSALSEDYDQTL
mgnify:CR=1 FL=1